jgi:hypothetical protein
MKQLIALWLCLIVVSASAASAQSDARPTLLCPHTASRYLYQDNASALNARTGTFLHGSLVAATQLLAAGRTQGFIYLDDKGNSWITVLPGADAPTRAYFHDVRYPTLMLLNAFTRSPNRPLPNWAHLEKCPSN